MQIRDDQNPLPNTNRSRPHATAPIQRLALRNPAEEDTVRLPLSVVAFWHDPVDPGFETLQLRLNLPENLDDDETLPGLRR